MSFATFWLMVLPFVRKIFRVCRIKTVSNITSTNPALHEYNLKNFAIFCYDYFEDLLAPTTFANISAF